MLPNLPTGPYRLEASLQGFRTYAQTGIVLQVAATPAINVVLGIGSLEETVSVEAAAPLVDVQSAGISDVVDNERILELPLQGRQVTDLIVLAGAAVQIGRAQRSNHPGRCFDLGRRRLADRRRISARRRVAQQPAEQREPADAVSRRAAGIPRRNERPDGPERDARGGLGERGHEVGHQRVSRQRLRVPPPPRLQRHQPVCRASVLTARARTTGCFAISSAARSAGRSRATSLFFFGGYQGTVLRFRPADQIAWVPTAAMLAGDFTTFASPACTGGRQVNAGRRRLSTTASIPRSSALRR